MKKKLSPVCAPVLLLLPLLLVGCTTTAGPEPVWVGHLAALEQTQGKEAEQAMLLTLEELREAGDWPLADRPVGVRHVDVSGKGAGRARAEASRLLAVNRVAGLIVGPGVAEINEVLSLTQAYDVPVIVLDELGRPVDLERVVPIGADQQRRREAITTLKRKHPGALVVEGNVEAPVSKSQQSDPIPEGGAYWVSAWLPLERLSAEARDWAGRYEKRFGSEPTYAALLGHDALSLYLAAMRQSKSADPAKIRKALAGIESFDGLAGQIRWSDGRVVRPLGVYRLREGKWRFVEETTE